MKRKRKRKERKGETHQSSALAFPIAETVAGSSTACRRKLEGRPRQGGRLRRLSAYRSVLDRRMSRAMAGQSVETRARWGDGRTALGEAGAVTRCGSMEVCRCSDPTAVLAIGHGGGGPTRIARSRQRGTDGGAADSGSVWLRRTEGYGGRFQIWLGGACETRRSRRRAAHRLGSESYGRGGCAPAYQSKVTLHLTNRRRSTRGGGSRRGRRC
ncbi:hypothetical protein M6B38_313710 [Iris pallida]|uniref:Uncharacterized protein n=1 Tax=Iris pallida TaxID=29817 RepID=A0AAX6HGA0_IRIPA|nr:hypothetical protein M6B38_313710 [Iris pallida]